MSKSTLDFLLNEEDDASGVAADAAVNGDSTVTDIGDIQGSGNDNETPDADGELTEAGLTTGDIAQLRQLAESQELISEQINIVRLNKQAKIANLTTRSALLLAKRKGDQLYTKYAKLNAARLQIRAMIVKKYGAKAASYARKLVAHMSTAAGAGAPKK
jgi:hypothetical protein